MPRTTDAGRRVAVLAVAVAIAIVAGCPGAGRDSRLITRADTPDDVREWCALAASRCTRCHTIERVTTARVGSPEHWQRYVARMRLMPASGITDDDAERIVKCLVFRSFGAEGLQQLEAPAGRQPVPDGEPASDDWVGLLDAVDDTTGGGEP